MLLRCMAAQPNRISFAFILLVLVLAGWLHMGALLLSVLFSYFCHQQAGIS
jgi:hypothetical protein